MNDPIINPWVFYMIGLCDNVFITCTVAAVVFVVLALVLTIGMVIDGIDGLPADKSVRKMAVILYAVGGVSALLALFVPSGTTVTAMVAANNITPATVAAAGRTVSESAETITRIILQTIKDVQ